jgi:ABC-type polar amino acid transport system ATPase subunit
VENGREDTMNPLLEVLQLSYSYGHLPVLSDVSFSLRRGEVLSIVGPSGAGKSTLLRTLGMLSSPTSGEILFQGQCVYGKHYDGKKYMPIGEFRRMVGIVFQEHYLWPHLTALWNVALPLICSGILKETAIEIASSLLESVSLGEFQDRMPDNMSVGQQQRCAIARTLAMKPKILLLDEITSGLDPELVSGIMSMLREIATDPDRTVVIVTHSMDFMRQVSDKVAYLDNGRLTPLYAIDEIPTGTLQKWCTRNINM